MSGFAVEDLPRSFDHTGVEAVLRARPEAFQVVEIPTTPADGIREHLYLDVEKRGQNTRWVAQQLAQAFDLAPLDVSYAGMKDRHGVTRQWFSLRRPQKSGSIQDVSLDSAFEKAAAIEGVRILGQTWHSRKLRRGQLKGNSFLITLSEVRGDLGRLTERLGQLKEHGVPNYFGEQRFGSDNLEKARQWILTDRKKRVSGFKKGLYLSVLRSWLFNQVLAQRVSDGTWRECLPGEVLEQGLPTPLTLHFPKN